MELEDNSIQNSQQKKLMGKLKNINIQKFNDKLT